MIKYGGQLYEEFVSEDCFKFLASCFGYNGLRSFQKVVIKCVLIDVFVSCKTGSGKSLFSRINKSL